MVTCKRRKHSFWHDEENVSEIAQCSNHQYHELYNKGLFAGVVPSGIF